MTGALLTTIWNPVNHQGGSQELLIALFLMLTGIHLSLSLCVLPDKASGEKRLTTHSYGYGTLTKREREVLGGLARGERRKEIAAHLGITERTVRAYLTSIYTKLNVDSRTAAIAVAVEHGLLAGEEKSNNK